MLITQLKSQEELERIFNDSPLFVLKCYGCKEIFFPEKDVENFLKINSQKIINDITVDYLCNINFTRRYIERFQSELKDARAVVVFSCGVGVQCVSSIFLESSDYSNLAIKVYSGCDTVYINGFQGLTAQRFNCALCGSCYLNYTAGICPITSCSKSLLNGPCGGAKNGKCEVNKDLDCGWGKIYHRLQELGKIELIQEIIPIRDYKV